MEPNFLCHDEKSHEDHICQLKKKGETIVDLAKHPEVSCLLCEALADSADHVCSPVELLPKNESRIPITKPEKGCSCAEKHEGHICELDRKGEKRLIEKMTDDPAVSCLSCGSEANSSEHVCSPVPIY